MSGVAKHKAQEAMERNESETALIIVDNAYEAVMDALTDLSVAAGAMLLDVGETDVEASVSNEAVEVAMRQMDTAADGYYDLLDVLRQYVPAVPRAAKPQILRCRDRDWDDITKKAYTDTVVLRQDWRLIIVTFRREVAAMRGF